MQWQFGPEQIEAWADLSGDRNPIHFDLEAARRMDAADVVVHGMLALLPIKHQMGRVAEGRDEDWVQFKALLKAPVLRNCPVALATRPRSASTAFTLRSEKVKASMCSAMCLKFRRQRGHRNPQASRLTGNM
ncbi:MaoC family dehydratase [Pseudomonas sp. Ap32]|nr:MaoC family dehydratase [Pseudomonas sp. Ap32]